MFAVTAVQPSPPLRYAIDAAAGLLVIQVTSIADGPALLAALREINFHTVIGGIALPNPASIALHERLGFRKVAHFEQVGWKFGRWIDVGYWQLLL